MLNTTHNPLVAKWAALGAWSPLDALKRTSETKWLIDGVIPSGSINWMVAAPSSFKTFLALDMAACIANGRDWHGRETAQALVLYIAGEGDADVHTRRAAADLAAGDTGPLCIVQVRPRLDESHGLASLLALVQSVTGENLEFSAIARYDALSDPYGDIDDRYLLLEERQRYDEIRTAKGWSEDGVRAYVLGQTRPRFSAWDEAIAQVREDACLNPPEGIGERITKNVFLVIDTYSQTSVDDAKGTVSRYIKTLRDLQEKAAALGGTITVLVIDHTTKSNESYMGSLAKLGDSDTMLEVTRHGDNNAVTLKSAKMRSGAPFAPIHLNLVPFTLEGFTDAQGRPLASLVVSDGEHAHRIRKAAASRPAIPRLLWRSPYSPKRANAPRPSYAKGSTPTPPTRGGKMQIR